MYAWTKNGTPVGTNSTAYSNNALSNGDMIQCTMTSNASCVNGNPAGSNIITTIITATNDGNACTTDACNTSTGQVSHTNIPVTDGNACTTDACNTSSGAISHTNVSVDDGNACTNDACNTSSGAITHTNINVDDNNACTNDACNTSSGAITHTAVVVSDGNACTNDACNTSTGTITHTQVSTDDGNACTNDACNTSTGTITHTPVAIDDGNACTNDNCDTSTGNITHTNVIVDDGNSCTIDGCNSVTGIFHNPQSEICGNNIDDDCDGLIDENCSGVITLSLRIYIQGFYSGNGLMDNGGMGGNLYIVDVPGATASDVDTVSVSLMNPSPPYDEVELRKGILKTNGDLTVTFSNVVVPGQSFYIRLRHRNSIETWSKLPVVFGNSTSYDFTIASTQAFDDGFNLPMKLVDTSPDRWAIYNGDIDGNDGVDSQDMTLEENASNQGLFGYYNSDVTGDGGSDSKDMTVIENNGNAGVFATRP